jgi:hypothetical protein
MKFWGVIAGVFAILMGGFLSLFSAKRAGANKEKAKHLEKDIEQSEKANEIRKEQLDAAADRPRDSDDLDDRMRDGRF